MININDCPRCGNKKMMLSTTAYATKEAIEEPGFFRVRCPECNRFGPYKLTLEEALNDWNSLEKG